MTEAPTPGSETSPATKGKFPFSWKQFSDFITSVVRIDRELRDLKEKNKKLDEIVARMQRQLDEQSGQIKTLGAFVHTALHDRIDTRAEQAAMNLLGRLTVFQEGPELPAPPRPKQKAPRARKR